MMKKINIRESLLQMDHDTDYKYDLTTLYGACRLTEDKKKELVKYIDGPTSPEDIGKFLQTECGDCPTSMSEEYDDDIVTDYTFVATKQVPDSDGFMTDYTWYRASDGTNVFVFGDSDIYTPEDGYFDHTTTSNKEAVEWFVDYTGFEDVTNSMSEEYDNDIYASTNSEYALFKKTYSHSRKFKDKDKQSGSIRDLIDELENKDISYEIYDNKTDNGCTVFYDDISDVKESFGDDLIDSQYLDDTSDGHWSWDYDDDELANIYGGDTKYDNHPGGVDIDEYDLDESTKGFVRSYCDNCGKMNRVKVEFKEFNKPFEDTIYTCSHCGAKNLLTDPHEYNDDGTIKESLSSRYIDKDGYVSISNIANSYIAKRKVAEDIDDSSELEANKMTIAPLAGLNADGFIVVINNAAGEELFKREYRYGYDASYDRESARGAEKDYNDSIKYGWKTPRTLKPYVADIIDELCSKYGIDKNSIEFVPGKNIFNGGNVKSDFVDKMKKLVYEAKQIKVFGAKAKKLDEAEDIKDMRRDHEGSVNYDSMSREDLVNYINNGFKDIRRGATYREFKSYLKELSPQSIINMSPEDFIVSLARRIDPNSRLDTYDASAPNFNHPMYCDATFLSGMSKSKFDSQLRSMGYKYVEHYNEYVDDYDPSALRYSPDTKIKKLKGGFKIHKWFTDGNIDDSDPKEGMCAKLSNTDLIKLARKVDELKKEYNHSFESLKESVSSSSFDRTKYEYNRCIAEDKETVTAISLKDAEDQLNSDEYDVLNEDKEEIPFNIEEIISSISTAVTDYVHNELGYDHDFIKDYVFVEAETTDKDMIKVEVRAELTYQEMEDLAQKLNPIIQIYDESAYFEQEDSGIMNAFIKTTYDSGEVDKSTCDRITNLLNSVKSFDELKKLYKDVIIPERDSWNEKTSNCIYDVIDGLIDKFEKDETNESIDSKHYHKPYFSESYQRPNKLYKMAQDIADYLGEFMNTSEFLNDNYFDEYDRDAMGKTFDALNDFAYNYSFNGDNIKDELKEGIQTNDLAANVEDAFVKDELDLFVADALRDGSATEETLLKIANDSSTIEIDDMKRAINAFKEFKKNKEDNILKSGRTH